MYNTFLVLRIRYIDTPISQEIKHQREKLKCLFFRMAHPLVASFWGGVYVTSVNRWNKVPIVTVVAARGGEGGNGRSIMGLMKPREEMGGRCPIKYK